MSESYTTYIDPILFSIIVLLLLAIFILIRRSQSAVSAHESIQVQMSEMQRRSDLASKEADHAKDIFLANISHETRTPMNAIIGLSHILLQGPLDESQKKDIEKIKQSAEKLLAVTNDMLDISQIKADKLEIESNTIDMNTFLSSLSHIIDQSLLRKRVDLLFDTAFDLPESFKGDALHISQVLVNLLNNALACTEEGSVTLQVSRQSGAQGEELNFSVVDTGAGLTNDEISTLFLTYDEIDNSANISYDRNALGLAISKELVERMGGHLVIKSRHKEGSTFSFALPLINPVEISERVTNRYKRLINKRDILIFADQTPTSELCKKKLTAYNATVRTVYTDKELHAMLKEQHYDALIISPKILRLIQDNSLIAKRCNHLITIENSREDPYESAIPIQAKLFKPFSTITLLQVMNDLFSHNITINPVPERIVTMDDILVLKGAKVLLAEDNEGNAMVIEGLLKDSGIELSVVNNGQKAVEAIFNDSVKYDLVIMDINMPVMDGYIATSIIREYQHLDTLPIIAMTANITESDVKKSRNIGMQAHLSKPVDTNKFYKTLLQFIPPKVTRTDPLVTSIPTPPVTDQFAPLIELGVNVDDGLMRLNGNTTTYTGILKRFAEMFRNSDKKFRQLYGAIKLDEGRELAHNLKGVAGNIGAKEIYRLANNIEDCFKGKSVDLSLDVEELDLYLSPLIEAIDHLEDVHESMEAKEINTKEVIGLLKALYIAAKNRKAVEIKKNFASIIQYSWPSAYKSPLDRLENSIKAYNFDNIRADIENIMHQIKASNGIIK